MGFTSLIFLPRTMKPYKAIENASKKSL